MDVGQPIYGYSKRFLFFGSHPPDNTLNKREYALHFLYIRNDLIIYVFNRHFGNNSAFFCSD